MKLELGSEAEVETAAAELARSWRDHELKPLLVGLRGPLGSGKTTWVRAMLRGLGHRGRVPSPTYTLLEEYRIGALAVVHVDLYRIQAATEIETLGIRDELAAENAWLLVEWPERVPALLARCDVIFSFAAFGATGRIVTVAAPSEIGRKAARAIGS